jgi:hypothetical protein
MGSSSQGTGACHRGGENCFGSSEKQTQNLGSGQEENGGCHTFTLGEVPGGKEEGGIETWSLLRVMWQAFLF